MKRLFVALAAALLFAAFVPCPAPAAPTTRLTPEQRKEVAELLRAFRGPAETADRKAAAERLLEIGGPATRQLLDAVNRLLRPLRSRYKKGFERAALQAVRTNLKDTTPDELKALRETIRTVAADPTKQRIVQEADPALARLTELLVVDTEEVLATDRSLAEARAELTELGAVWQRCMDAVAKENTDVPSFTEVLETEERLATTMPLATKAHWKKTLTGNILKARRIKPEEAAGIRYCNVIRMLAGLNPLRIDVKLCEAGRDHSKDMQEKGFFDHESPVPGKKTFSDRARNFGTTAHAENIAMGATNGKGAIMQWWHSPGHLTNMMGRHSRIGLGRHEKHWTQLFG